jgi:hypothetical protein
MSMSMPKLTLPGGLPGLDQPVMLHSSRASSCSLSAADCAWRAYPWRFWYKADYVYAQGTVILFCIVIALFALGNVYSRYLAR